MKNIKYYYLKLSNIEKYIPPFKLRGFIGNKFKQHLLLHHHIDNNKYLYKYPLVQYKNIKSSYYIIGIEEGSDILKRIWTSIDKLKIDNVDIPIYEKELIIKNYEIGEIEDPVEYKFLSPYIALNQKNYSDYKNMSYSEQKEKLQKILINNVISFCKSINYTINQKLITTINLKSEICNLKGIGVYSFKGTFNINFLLPDYIGLGKSVSRGFGTIYKY